MSNELATIADVSVMPTQNEWQLMTQMAQQLVPTGFLPKAIDTPQKAVAIMLKSRELRIPFMYGLAHISIIQGKPNTDAELMLALVQRDHGSGAMRVKVSDDKHCTVEYRVAGWGSETQEYTFSITDATRAGLNTDTWKKYPAAMLRARCISSVARMAFPAAIGGLYVAGELGDDVEVDSDGVVRSVNTTTGEIIEPDAIEANVEPTPERDEIALAKGRVWDIAKNTYGWDIAKLEGVAARKFNVTNLVMSDLNLAQMIRLHGELSAMAPETWQKVRDNEPVELPQIPEAELADLAS